jgi:hypothetical protein
MVFTIKMAYKPIPLLQLPPRLILNPKTLEHGFKKMRVVTFSLPLTGPESEIKIK